MTTVLNVKVDECAHSDEENVLRPFDTDLSVGDIIIKYFPNVISKLVKVTGKDGQHREKKDVAIELLVSDLVNFGIKFIHIHCRSYERDPSWLPGARAVVPARFTLATQQIRVGTYQRPTATRYLVLIRKNRITLLFFEDSEEESLHIEIYPEDIRQCLVNFGSDHSMFLLTSPACGARLRNYLGIPNHTNPNDSPPEPYFDPFCYAICYQFITILFEPILDDASKLQLKSLLRAFSARAVTRGRRVDDGPSFLVELSVNEARAVYRQTLASPWKQEDRDVHSDEEWEEEEEDEREEEEEEEEDSEKQCSTGTQTDQEKEDLEEEEEEEEDEEIEDKKDGADSPDMGRDQQQAGGGDGRRSGSGSPSPHKDGGFVSPDGK